MDLINSFEDLLQRNYQFLLLPTIFYIYHHIQLQRKFTKWAIGGVICIRATFRKSIDICESVSGNLPKNL